MQILEQETEHYEHNTVYVIYTWEKYLLTFGIIQRFNSYNVHRKRTYDLYTKIISTGLKIPQDTKRPPFVIKSQYSFAL